MSLTFNIETHDQLWTKNETNMIERVPLISYKADWEVDGVAICTANYEQWYPQVVSDSVGGAIITWRDFRSASDYDIYAQRINTTGDVQWTTDGIEICTANDPQDYPQLISDGVGGAIITWQDNRSSNTDIYAQRINATGDVQWTPDGVKIGTAFNIQWGGPQLVSDGARGAIIIWYDFRNGNADIYVQRINATGEVQWTPNGVAICTANNAQENPQLVSDGVGGAIITWQDRRSGSSHIYSQRINTTGDVQWTPNGVAICTATHAQYFPRLVSDGAGGAIITWQDSRPSGTDVYAQKINATGDVQWTTNGVEICTASNTQWGIQLVRDKAGGAIITWQDYRSGVHNSGIFAQRINSSGDAQWITNGMEICTASNDQSSPQLISDNTGGALITWKDERNSQDIYVQRVNSTGNVKWTPNGVEICTEDSVQWYPQLVSDGSGGAIITWQDNRNSAFDIFAQSIKNEIPFTDSPADILTTLTSSQMIRWVLQDDQGSGKYRVLINDTTGQYYVWVDWTPWTNNEILTVPINRIALGTFNYTIEYYDDQNVFGLKDTIKIIIIEVSSGNNNDDKDKTEAIPFVNFYITIIIISIICLVLFGIRKKFLFKK